MKQLPQEVWTEVLHHVSCPELWYACRLVSRRFHKDSNFILRTQYISQDISIISGKTYMSFSHIDTANKACFTPSEIPERNPRQAMFLRRLKDRKYRNWHNDKAPLIIMQLPRPYELPPRTHDQFQYMFPSRFLWTDKSRAGVEVRTEGVSLDWRQVYAKYMVLWKHRDLRGWTRNMQEKQKMRRSLEKRAEDEQRLKIWVPRSYDI
jgi:hypothetical protein